jgi:hypothetical protein
MNCSYWIEVRVHNAIADSWKIFRLEDDFSIRADVKNTADSLQSLIFPHKIKIQNRPRYLSLSEKGAQKS